MDMTNTGQVEGALRPATRLVWIETPSNPLLTITDIAATAGIAGSAGALLVCDNTLATPVLQKPLELGADLVKHSTTKYLGGHADIMGGAVVAKSRPGFFERVQWLQANTGGIPAPFDCWLLLRSIRTLPYRVRAHADNALTVAALRLITRATSYGGVESVIEHRASIEGPESRTPPSLLRLSVGLEHPDDLIEDLAQALGQ